METNTKSEVGNTLNNSKVTRQQPAANGSKVERGIVGLSEHGELIASGKTVAPVQRVDHLDDDYDNHDVYDAHGRPRFGDGPPGDCPWPKRTKPTYAGTWLLSTKEACQLLGGISARTLRRLEQRGLIKPWRMLRTLRWRTSDVKLLIEGGF